MAEDSRPTKRRRSSSMGPRPLIIIAPGEQCDPTTGQETFTRHADFWLQDGNLILLAGNTAFRILRSLLLKKSAVFADMFATGCPDATESFDGCPVVRLSDHPDDLRDFLQHLVPCAPLRPSFGVTMSNFSELHAAIHLAHKYQCPDVEAHVLSILQDYYAPAFSTYDKYSSSASVVATPLQSAALAAVNIARLTNTPSMLPFALYLLCTTLPAYMIDGYPRRDGSVEHLSAQDLKACVRARSELAWALASRLETVFALAPTVGCEQTRGQCTRARKQLVQKVHKKTRGSCDALQCFRESIEDWARWFKLCKVCKRDMLAREDQERRRVWGELPGMFGLMPSGEFVGCQRKDSDAEDSDSF